MSTRYASPGSPAAHERFMSSPEIAARRGLAGNLIAAKAQLYAAPRHREMLFFLQAMSLRPGGLREVGRKLVRLFPERVGTPTMHRLRMGEGVRYGLTEMGAIEQEIDFEFWAGPGSLHVRMGARMATAGASPDLANFAGTMATLYEEEDEVESLASLKVQALCVELCGKLEDALTALCLDPALDLEDIERRDWMRAAGYFSGIWSALSELKRQEETPAAELVTTTIGEQVNDTLDYVLAVGGIGVVEGNSGAGKSTAATRWCARHLGEVRFVSLSGITHKTGFFTKIAAALGLATCQRKSCELQAKVEDFFQSTRLMLVLDEAHYLFPQARRVYSSPELVDWVNTLANAGVPIALICTDQFARLKKNVEKQTGWTSEQLEHRIRRYTKLPTTPTAADIHTVAESLLSMEWSEDAREWVPSAVPCDEDGLDMITAYAATSRLPMASVRDSVQEARYTAHRAGRNIVLSSDILQAMEGRQYASDAAMKAAFPSEPAPRAPRSARRSKVFVSEQMPSEPEQMSNHCAPSDAAAVPMRRVESAILTH